MRRTTCLALMLMLIHVLSACQPPAGESSLPDPPALALDGLDAEVVQQIRTAQRQWEASPRSASANGALAMLLQAYRQADWASVYYERARLLDKEDFKWAYLHALVLIEQGQREEATAALREALALKGDYLPARLNLAAQLADAGQDDESRALYDDLVATAPDLPQVLYGLGRLRLKDGDQTGLMLLERAARIDSPYGAAHYALAGAYRQLGNRAKAEEHLALFETRRKREPPLQDELLAAVNALNLSKHGHMDTARRLLGQGKINEAARAFELALEKDPSDVSAHIFLIVAYGALGRYEDAEAHYDQGIALDPDWAQLHGNLGVLRLKQRRFDDAAQAFRDAIAVDPDYLTGYVKLGVALESSGKLIEAADQYRIAVSREPGNRQAHYFLSRVLMRQADYAGAVEQLQQTLEPVDKQTPEYLRVLALAYQRTSNYAQAEAALQRAIEVADRFGRRDLLAALQEDLRRVRAAQNAPSESTD